MKQFCLFSLLGSLMLTLVPVLVLGAPPAIRQAEDYSWPQCNPQNYGSCTIYMATSDPDIDDYRTAVLFDDKCNVVHAIMDSKNTPKLTLRGTLPYYVDLFVDSNIHPGGYLSYRGLRTALGESMTCYKPPNSDGVGCRKLFVCT